MAAEGTKGARRGITLSDRLRLEAHDLKAPITNILSSAELLIRSPPQRREQERFLAIIADNARVLQRRVQNLLDLRVSERAEFVARLGPVDGAACLQAAVNQLAWAMRNRETKLHIDFPSPFPPFQADAELVERILLNLLDNAVRIGPAGGEVEVSAAVGRDGVTFEVSDRARWRNPVPPAEIFGHARDTLDDAAREPGKGLGLAFCLLAVEAHGGGIEARARKGGGTTVRFTIPAA